MPWWGWLAIGIGIWLILFVIGTCFVMGAAILNADWPLPERPENRVKDELDYPTQG